MIVIKDNSLIRRKITISSIYGSLGLGLFFLLKGKYNPDALSTKSLKQDDNVLQDMAD